MNEMSCSIGYEDIYNNFYSFSTLFDKLPKEPLIKFVGLILLLYK